MNGLLQGQGNVGWCDVPLLAMETIGADSLNACVKANDWVELPNITRLVSSWDVYIYTLLSLY